MCTEVSKSMKEVLKQHYCVTMNLISHFCVIKFEHQKLKIPSKVITHVLINASELNYIVAVVLHIFLKVGVTRSCHK